MAPMTTAFIRRLSSLALLCALPLASASCWSQSKQKLPEIKFQKYTLPNGLTVITHEDHKLPLVSVDLW